MLLKIYKIAYDYYYDGQMVTVAYYPATYYVCFYAVLVTVLFCLTLSKHFNFLFREP